MFRTGETYETSEGGSCIILCSNAEYIVNNHPAPIIGIVTSKKTQSKSLTSFYENGKWSGAPNAPNIWDLISNEPTEEELALIRDIGDYCERSGGEDQQERLLRIVRALRKK